MPIKKLKARQILDSKGTPTVEVDLLTDLGLFRASIPSSSSNSEFQAKELRDEDESLFQGLSVTKVVGTINDIISPCLIKSGLEVTQQEEIDSLMTLVDGTKDKSTFGANALLPVSVAVAKAGAAKRGVPLYQHFAWLARNEEIILPVPYFNVINGGIIASNKLYIQEFMIVPTGACNFTQAVKMGAEVYKCLKDALVTKYGASGAAVSDEGGFVPNIPTNKAAFTYLQNAIAKAGHIGKVDIALRIAASEFYDPAIDKYNVDFKQKKKTTKPKKGGGPLTQKQLQQQYMGFLKQFSLASIEDPFDKEKWDHWSLFKKSVDIQIVADALTGCSEERISSAIDANCCNAVLIRVTQIGTISEIIKMHNFIRQNGWGTLLSDTLGETEDTFIADLAVGLSTGQLKSGGPCRSERVSKYNHIMRIEEELGNNAKYAGRSFRNPLCNM